MMSAHLKPEQYGSYLAGTESREAEQHVEACPKCRAEIAQFEHVLGGFRTSVTEWSEQCLTAPRTVVAASRRRPYTWGLAAAAACLAVVLGTPEAMRRTTGPQSSATAVPAAAPAIDDSQLLTEIDASLTRSYASAMEPLAPAWDASRGESN